MARARRWHDVGAQIKINNGAVTLGNLDADPRAEVIIGAAVLDDDGLVVWDQGGSGNGDFVGSNDGYNGGITVRTGEPVFARLHGGKDLWTWFAEDAPEAGRLFHDSMCELTRVTAPLLPAAHDFARRPLRAPAGQRLRSSVARLGRLPPEAHPARSE